MVGSIKPDDTQEYNNQYKKRTMQQKHAVRYIAGEENEMIDKIILEFYSLQTRQKQHKSNRAQQVIKRKEIENREFTLNIFICRKPVISHIGQINNQANGQKLIAVIVPKILIKKAYVCCQQANGNSIHSQNNDLFEFCIL